MGKTIQAIALIVAHRNDDLTSTFDSSSMAANATASKASKDAAAAALASLRPRIGLGGGVKATLVEKKPLPPPPLTSKPSQAPPPPLPSPADAPASSSAAAHEGALLASPASCPHVKPGKGKKPQPASLCQECLRTQDPSAVLAVAPSGGKAVAYGAFSSSAAVTRPYCKATLVICPVVAIIQWRDEILKFTAPGSLVVMIHHGSKRKQGEAGIEELENADVVLTTYSIIESENRRFMLPPKICCTYCKRKFLPEKLKVHLRFFCGPNAVKSEALAKQQKKRKPDEDEEEEEEERAGPSNKKSKGGSKGAASSSKSSSSKGKRQSKGKGKASNEEEEEEEEEEEGKAKDPKSTMKKNRDAFKKWWFKGEGGEDDVWAKKAQEEAEAMIQAAEDAQKREEDGPSSILHSIKWRRIILDEAHSIKDRRSSTAKAVFSLDSKYK